MTTNKPDDFDHFLKQLKTATSKIESDYFKLPIANAESKCRERVYCYELYHQLRCTLGNAFPYMVAGEVNKTGHPFIEGNKIPDFIVHFPGTMENNLVIIEVKPTNATRQEIKEDIEKFKIFLNEGYYQAIMLIYGGDRNKVDYAQSEIAKSPHSKNILLLWHKEPGGEAIAKNV